MLTARSVKHLTRTRGFCLTSSLLLGGEVKVESGLKPVKLELAGREEVSWRWCCLESESLLDWLSWLLEVRLLNWSLTSRGRSSELLSTSLVTSEQTSLLVRSIIWVDEWVDSSTVSAGRNTVDKVSCIGIVVVVVGGKVGSVSVEIEVTVSGVMGVDEWVKVGINWLIIIVIVNWLCNRSCLTDRCSNLDGSNRSRCRGLGYKCSRFKTSSSGGNMISF